MVPADPDRLVETGDITMMWYTAIPTAGKIGANCPDIFFRNKKRNTCSLIDISCPADGNIARKQAEKLTKYRDLRVEVSHMWQCQTLVVPVVVWEHWAQCTQVLHGGFTLFQVITTCSTYRKQCFLDPLRSCVESCLLFRQP